MCGKQINRTSVPDVLSCALFSFFTRNKSIVSNIHYIRTCLLHKKLTSPSFYRASEVSSDSMSSLANVPSGFEIASTMNAVPSATSVKYIDEEEQRPCDSLPSSSPHTKEDVLELKQSTDTLSTGYSAKEEDNWISIVDDTYTMFFLSHCRGIAFFFSAYVFVLKMALFTLLACSILENGDNFPSRSDMDTKVIVSQALILPVAVAMQEDLISSIFMITNVSYHPSIRESNPCATRPKFYLSCACRFLDGMYSLVVNFIVLITATEVKELLLNFAALQFLQNIDNLALQMAEDGFMGGHLEEVGSKVRIAKLPATTSEFQRSLDTLLFVLISLSFLVAWLLFLFIWSE